MEINYGSGNRNDPAKSSAWQRLPDDYWDTWYKPIPGSPRRKDIWEMTHEERQEEFNRLLELDRKRDGHE